MERNTFGSNEDEEVTEKSEPPPGEILKKLREVERLVASGRSTSEALRLADIAEYVYYRWRREYGRYGR